METIPVRDHFTVGRYKGRPVAIVRYNRPYLGWCLTAGLQMQHPELVEYLQMPEPETCGVRIPFGIYTGFPVEVLQLDEDYVAWCRQCNKLTDHPEIERLVDTWFPFDTPEQQAQRIGEQTTALFTGAIDPALVDMVMEPGSIEPPESSSADLPSMVDEQPATRMPWESPDEN